MAMPLSGTIYLMCCHAIACSSIACAVCGTAPSPSCLSALSIAAGKTAPYAMTDFYGYNNVFKQIGFSNISRTGTVGVSPTVCSLDCICSNSAMVVGQCYTITLCHQICSNTAAGSRACVQVCGVAVPYSCTILAGSAGVNFSCSFVVAQGNAVCIINLAIHVSAGGTCCSCAHSCITTIAATLGLFCKTTGCSDCMVSACP